MSGRIVTVTLNPALDLQSSADVVRPVHKIRTSDDRVDPGGGGINVARVVHELGGDALALITVGGITGHYIEDLLDEAGVNRIPVPIAGRNRISLTVLERASGLAYRFVPQGPHLAEHEWKDVLDRLEAVEACWVVASGSLPPGAPPDAYGQMARLAVRRRISFALDTSGPALRKALDVGVDLVKPSLSELESLVGHRLSNRAEQERELAALVRSGAARIVALTLGAEGVLCTTSDTQFQLAGAQEDVGSAVGAGDSFLGGMVLALSRGACARDAVAWGIACGSSAAAATGTARINREDVERRYKALAEPPVQAIT